MRCTGSGSSCSSNNSSSTLVACCEKNAKFTPLSCTDAPSGCGRPGSVVYCSTSGARPRVVPAAARTSRRLVTVPSAFATERPALLPLRFSATCTPSRRAAALPRLSDHRRNVLLIGEPLADLDDVAVGILDPRRPPPGDERVETERPERDLRLAADRRQHLIDVVDLERDVAEAAGVGRTVLLGRAARRRAGRREQLEIHGARFEEHD